MLRLLLFVASPEDLDPERSRLDFEREEELLFNAMDRSLAHGEVEIDVAEDGVLAILLARLEEQRYHAMTEPAKTFKVLCAHTDCQKPFHVRFPLARPDATGTSEVVVTCLHCDKQVVIVIPRVYIEADALVRGLTSRPMPQ